MCTEHSTVIVRQAQASDAEAIGEMFLEVVREGTAFLSDDTATRESGLALWFAPDVVAYVASVEGEIVGAYMVKPNHHGRGSHVANATYMVTAPWRRQGIGKTLGAHSLQVAKALGFTAMQFNSVVSTNVASVRLWESLGFVIVGTVPKGFQHATLGLVDLHIMHRFL